jgi:DNA replication and repair protein RecF
VLVTLEELTVENIRCLSRAQLHLHPGLNLIWGDNGSGKTTLLEAMFLLGRGRSFRTRTSERLIRFGEERLVSLGRLAAEIPHSAAVQVIRGGRTEARVDGRPVETFAELAHVFPVQAIEPGVHRLVEEGGHRRRRWLDWAVFHVEPSHVSTWTRYSRALKQRNAALRVSPEQSHAWDPELARDGEMLAASRGRLIESLQPFWTRTVRELTDLEVELTYSRGWTAEEPLAAALIAGAARDRLHGVTHAGPHRADVRLRVHGRPAREVLSRGQQKLVAVAMILSQLELLRTQADTGPTLLLDDPAAELDQERLDRFIAVMQRLSGQLITTSLRPDVHLFGKPDRVFHVEQGRVQPV